MYNHGNGLTEEITSQMIPRTVLIAYKGEGKLENEYYVEVRNINDDGVMGAGMPVTYKFMEEIAANYVDAHSGTPHGIVPRNMLYCDTRKGSEKYVWYNPPGMRRMYFRKSLGIGDGEYHVPGVVYVAGYGSLNIYAYKGEGIDAGTELLFGPFFNTTKASVCLGSAKLKMPANPTYGQLIEYWEKRFWCTEFSHLGGCGNPTRDNLVVVTQAAADKPFDEKQLLQANIKVSDLYK